MFEFNSWWCRKKSHFTEGFNSKENHAERSKMGQFLFALYIIPLCPFAKKRREIYIILSYTSRIEQKTIKCCIELQSIRHQLTPRASFFLNARFSPSGLLWRFFIFLATAKDVCSRSRGVVWTVFSAEFFSRDSFQERSLALVFVVCFLRRERAPLLRRRKRRKRGRGEFFRGPRQQRSYRICARLLPCFFCLLRRAVRAKGD